MELSHENQLLMETTKRFVEEEIMPHEALVDQLGEVPVEIGRQIEEKSKEIGLFAANLPEEVGGGGLDYSGQMLIEREFGKTSHALHAWAARPTEILLAGTEAQKEKYLFPCISGRKKRTLCLDGTGSWFRHHVYEVQCQTRWSRLDLEWL